MVKILTREESKYEKEQTVKWKSGKFVQFWSKEIENMCTPEVNMSISSEEGDNHAQLTHSQA